MNEQQILTETDPIGFGYRSGQQLSKPEETEDVQAFTAKDLFNPTYDLSKDLLSVNDQVTAKNGRVGLVSVLGTLGFTVVYGTNKKDKDRVFYKFENPMPLGNYTDEFTIVKVEPKEWFDQHEEENPEFYDTDLVDQPGAGAYIPSPIKRTPEEIMRSSVHARWIVPNVVAGSARPGYPYDKSYDEDINLWFDTIKETLGIVPATIIVFTTDKELKEFYPEFNLLTLYRDKGIVVHHLPKVDPVGAYLESIRHEGIVEKKRASFLTGIPEPTGTPSPYTLPQSYKIIPSKPLFSIKELQQIKTWIDESPKPVLIHCSAGIDRTGAVEQWLKSVYNIQPDIPKTMQIPEKPNSQLQKYLKKFQDIDTKQSQF